MSSSVKCGILDTNPLLAPWLRSALAGGPGTLRPRPGGVGSWGPGFHPAKQATCWWANPRPGGPWACTCQGPCPLSRAAAGPRPRPPLPAPTTAAPPRTGRRRSCGGDGGPEVGGGGLRAGGPLAWQWNSPTGGRGAPEGRHGVVFCVAPEEHRMNSRRTGMGSSQGGINVSVREVVPGALHACVQ